MSSRDRRGTARRRAVNPRAALFAAVLAISLVRAAHAGLDEGIAAYRRGDYQAALRELRPLAEEGVPEAQSVLGVMFADGLGVAENPPEALKWFRRASEQGLADAQLNLGSMYFLGRQVPEDHVEAVKWYRRAAEQGHPQAQFNLGSMYSVGQGAPRDYVLAYMWCTLSAANLPAGEARDRRAGRCERVVPRMTKEEVARAREMASKFVPRQERAARPPAEPLR
jgi:TPR repeat protein